MSGEEEEASEREVGERERRGRSKGEEADIILLQLSPSYNFSIDSQPSHTVKLFIFKLFSC